MGYENGRYGVVDKFTGETVSGVVVAARKRNKILRDEPYMLAFLLSFGELAIDKEIGVGEWRLLAHLISKIGMRNHWEIANLADVADVLGMRRQNVGRAMKVLVAKGIIRQGARIGKGHAYWLNSEYGWRGKIEELAEFRKDQP